jgi:acetamidase/formamidase
MKTSLQFFLVIALMFLGSPVKSAGKSPFDGEWVFHFVNFGEEFAPARVRITTSGSSLNGALNELSISGNVAGDTLSFRAVRPNGTEFGQFNGKLSGNGLAGSMSDRGNQVRWVMRRIPMPSHSAIHQYEAMSYSRTFSSDKDPVLRVFPGEVVRTSTLDAAGYDKNGVRRSFGGNPQVGPFYVYGALPGDTLVVRLLSVKLNRDTGRSGTQLVPTVVTHDYHRSAQYSSTVSGDWILDRQELIARPADPSRKMREFRVPLRPFLGGIGVAPDNGQAIDARSLGSFGGNLDYHAVTAGATIYLPVLEEGALLYIGDGHAAQGDGELAGDAIETSLDVELEVQLIKAKSVGGPRIENRDYLMAAGIAGSTQDALRLGTTELATWLAEDYELSPDEIALLLGVVVEYDVAAIIGPQVNIVAKIRKSHLDAIAK